MPLSSSSSKEFEEHEEAEDRSNEDLHGDDEDLRKRRCELLRLRIRDLATHTLAEYEALLQTLAETDDGGKRGVSLTSKSAVVKIASKSETVNKIGIEIIHPNANLQFMLAELCNDKLVFRILIWKKSFKVLIWGKASRHSQVDSATVADGPKGYIMVVTSFPRC
ncbi:uncharacterized protein HKW66_Vig0001970 [Vigna angularis]|uniref:Uncharacterized protein n=1 Tax=Phaseolus angularis TaxID=3914 RepID=A0A8T0LD87_PHAAN|nr:uncharacterized protein HKW66_Vig0001970 [Vigna angularis]